MDRDRRRRFGQNFLDVETANLLASDIPLSSEDSILEIGPGHGALTEPLLAQGVPVTAVEIDEECVAYLQNKFAENPNFHVVNQDFLRFPIDEWLKENPKPWLAGNLPYNVSTGIVAKVM
ncbi:MAG: rRNA adenine N-6-methyltransferase family protein, partial [Hallerella sp.]|nr:rRNA adenine N-6-methyltransferase family protein [Hallerella sp.]